VTSKFEAYPDFVKINNSRILYHLNTIFGVIGAYEMGVN